MNFWPVVIGGVLLGVAAWQIRERLAGHQHDRQGEPSPMPVDHASHLVNPLRQLVQPAGALLDAAGIAPGMKVLELGPGPGYFTLPAARRVGPEGHVLAVDVQPEMLALLEQRLSRAGTANVTLRAADAYHLPAADASYDSALLVSVLGEIQDRPRALQELGRVLQPGGTLRIGESIADPDRLGQKEVIGLCREAGFEHYGSYGTWFWYAPRFRLADQ